MKLHKQQQTVRMMTTIFLRKLEDIIHETSLSTSNIQDSDINFHKKTMNSTYDLVEKDFIYQTPLSTSNIQDDDNIADPSENDLVVNPHIDETPIMAEQGQISPVNVVKKCAEYYQHQFAGTIYYV
jgi:hypothetical protein